MNDFWMNEDVSEFHISCTVISTSSGGNVVMVKDNDGPGAGTANVNLNGKKFKKNRMDFSKKNTSTAVSGLDWELNV